MFRVLKQSLDANTSSDVYEKLEILERNKREYDLSTKAESANIANIGKEKLNPQNYRYKQKQLETI